MKIFIIICIIISGLIWFNFGFRVGKDKFQIKDWNIKNLPLFSEFSYEGKITDIFIKDRMLHIKDKDDYIVMISLIQQK